MRFRNLLVAFLIVCLGFLGACSDGQAKAYDPNTITYDEIVNTGLANKCPQINEFTRGSIDISPDQPLAVVDMCLEPEEYFVKEEPVNKRKEAEYIQAKVLTRDTTSLEQIRGSIVADEEGVLTFKEFDGIDFQIITLLLPGGDQVPFFFTIKQLTAQTEPGFTSVNSSTDFKGDFKVPSYRGASFIDPKGRGLTIGYDNAVALPAGADKSEYARNNIKKAEIMKGEMSLQITKVDAETGEIAGIFESEQPSSTDLGAEDPEEVKIRGSFYARLEPQI
ncbi:photosystem II manganese-stabilizing polypeptide [Cyanobacterium stanieri LEGE 03274]|uniref:Photosystem II extrinsic protein O n=1 Tax=Cyanobacterium stanieri LEGE 03274 TaxID=1828756 RepID=A0ABR9V2J7_9CHRO|nr:photosystem II manganese-stabilizing polypeptide [Cyanobacterium stanieri]MBE9222067.1 photosystem II manganese-stabilizing polypeptide [Cyanobacterium stanieri LEGE 03274]